ncbi:nucleotide sugar dehydrogenase [Cellulomonas sp. C5510]|nr:nucleotide sugar dehydrogenase [Cellulomonas sp. C5510]
MRVAVIGCGRVGATQAALLAAAGHDVVGVDVDESRVAALAAGDVPFHEPGLAAPLAAGLSGGRLRFTSDVAAAAGARVHLVCVGTSTRHAGAGARRGGVEAALAGLVPHLQPGDVVVGRSTVPVGTSRALAARVERAGATFVVQPDLLRTGPAVPHALDPGRVVYGLPTDADGVVTPEGEKARALLAGLEPHAPAHELPAVVTDYATAELAALATGAFLAVKASFVAAVTVLCEASGADVAALADALGHDTRIGRRWLDPGRASGGGRPTEDVRALVAAAEGLGVGRETALLREVDAVTVRHRVALVDLVRDACGGAVAGRRVAVLGAASWAGSDDVHDSPALSVAAQLQLQGAHVTVTDPRALDAVRAVAPALDPAATVAACVAGADAVVLATPWPEYAALDPRPLTALVARPWVLDACHVLDPARWRAAGWTYRAAGRR